MKFIHKHNKDHHILAQEYVQRWLSGEDVGLKARG